MSKEERRWTYMELANKLADYKALYSEREDKQRTADAKKKEMESFLREVAERDERLYRLRLEIAGMVDTLEKP